MTRKALKHVHACAVLLAVVSATAAGALEARRLDGLVGGTTGTKSAPTDPGRKVASVVELDNLLRDESFKGKIVIPKDIEWKMERCDQARDEFGRFYCTPIFEIPIRSGVRLVGERGDLRSRPILYSDFLPPVKSGKKKLFVVSGNNASVEGIHFRGGKKTKDHKKPHDYFHAITVEVDANRERPLGRNVLIADNEFEQWTGSGVNVVGWQGSVLLEDWDPAWTIPKKEDAGLVRVERNYMHRNVMDGGGYGVVVGAGAFVTIEGNVFDYNRHAIAASGKAYSGYVARFNYVLQGGYMQHANNAPDFHNQHFDVHGTADDGYGGYAGEYFEIAMNTIRGEQEYYAGLKTRPAFMLRGKPAQGAHFNGNVAVHDDLDEAVSLKNRGDSGIGEDHKKFNFHAKGNRFDADYSTEIAPGDFDGDGRTDVFVANGTAWFFSRAGIRPWEFLHVSNKRTGDLGFADIDNDRVTDVLWRETSGKLGYLKGGKGALVPLTSAPVAMKDLRFGDFDGDRKTDIFYTQKEQWRIWYGGARAWKDAATSGKKIGELLFGEFDDVRGTDVAAVTGGGWGISSGALKAWAQINKKHVGSFEKAVAADFDGNGKTDIAWNDGTKWRHSRDGRGPEATLREGTMLYTTLKGFLIGPFDGGTKAKVVGFDTVVNLPKPPGPGFRLVIWDGLGSPKTLANRSLHNMR